MPVRFIGLDGMPLCQDVKTITSLNLLGHAQLEELSLGSKCGGHGRCGADRLQVRRGASALSPITQSERQLLSAEQLAENERLACQAFPNDENEWIEVVKLTY